MLTFRRFSSVASFGTDYFPLKIKIIAKRKRELTTKFAIARNGCWQMPFILSVSILFCNPLIIRLRVSINVSRRGINTNRIIINISQTVININWIDININMTNININAKRIYITAERIYIVAIAININQRGSFIFLFVTYNVFIFPKSVQIIPN